MWLWEDATYSNFYEKYIFVIKKIIKIIFFQQKKLNRRRQSCPIVQDTPTLEHILNVGYTVLSEEAHNNEHQPSGSVGMQAVQVAQWESSIKYQSNSKEHHMLNGWIALGGTKTKQDQAVRDKLKP